MSSGFDLAKFANESEVRRSLKDLRAQRAEVLREYRKAVESLRRRAQSSPDWAQLYRDALEDLFVDELSLHDVVMVARNHKKPLVHADSFFRKIVERRRMKQLGAVPEKFLGLDKDRDVEFAEIAGFRVARTLWRGNLAEVPEGLRESTFLKPTISSGSKGAFTLFAADDIFCTMNAKRLSSWSAVRDEAARQLARQDVDLIEWQVQELVCEAPGTPARDLKFYSFYGEVGLIVEVVRNPTRQYEYFDPDGRIADSGRVHSVQPPFKDPRDTVTDKGFISGEMFKTVRRLSLSIPAPFMRIDFLLGQGELVFCEFSSSPAFSHIHPPKYQAKLGKMYLEAQMRLEADLASGKEFSAYRQWSQG